MNEATLVTPTNKAFIYSLCRQFDSDHIRNATMLTMTISHSATISHTVSRAMSAAIPVARLSIIRSSSHPLLAGNFHTSSVYKRDSRAFLATAVPKNHESVTSNIPLVPSNQDSVVGNAGKKLLDKDIHEKRDFYWSHPVYTKEEYEAIQVLSHSFVLQLTQIGHHEASSFSEYVALAAVRTLRTCFDYFTGYKHSPGEQDLINPKLIIDIANGKKEPTVQNVPKPVQMTEKEWLLRIIFLETIAGVPGMVGGMLRHLRSLRKLEKEGRWIETLLEEAENERMHLMTFMAIQKPKFLTRMMIVGAQGVFCNAFFFAYLLYPSQTLLHYQVPNM